MKKTMISLTLCMMAISSLLAVHFVPGWAGQNPYLAMNIYVYGANVLGTELGAGDEIGIFDGDTCVGATVLTQTCNEYYGNCASIVVALDGGDVPSTATPGHFIKCKLYQASTDTEYSYPDLAVHFAGAHDYAGVVWPTTFQSEGSRTTHIIEIRYDEQDPAESEFLSEDEFVPVPISFPASGVILDAIGALKSGPVWTDNAINASGTMTARYIPAPSLDYYFSGVNPNYTSSYHWDIDPGTIGYTATPEHPIVLRFDTTNLPGTGTDLANVKVYRRDIHGTGEFIECPTTVEGTYLVAETTGFGEFILGSFGADTLPIELSSFTASLNSQHHVNIQWVTQSETGVLGFRIYRASNPDPAEAELISPLIPATNTSHSQLYLYKDTGLNCDGVYYYWLESSDLDGTATLHGPISLLYEAWADHCNLPVTPVNGINRVYPNPFNPIAFITYGLKQKSPVDIRIYNTRGQVVRHFATENKEAGTYKTEWDGKNDNGKSCASGVYLLKMSTAMGSFNHKILLSK